jgi:chaperonin cofactor prefoldin
MEDIMNKLEEDSNKYKNIGSILSRLKESGFLA